MNTWSRKFNTTEFIQTQTVSGIFIFQACDTNNQIQGQKKRKQKKNIERLFPFPFLSIIGINYLFCNARRISRTNTDCSQYNRTSTSTTLTVPNCGQFTWYQKKKNSSNLHLYDINVRVIRTLSSTRFMSVLNRFECTKD